MNQKTLLCHPHSDEYTKELDAMVRQRSYGSERAIAITMVTPNRSRLLMLERLTLACSYRSTMACWTSLTIGSAPFADSSSPTTLSWPVTTALISPCELLGYVSDAWP